jgi:3'(2'), 5'-bisphosphate nucleotidase
VRGSDVFTVNVALVDEGRPVFGAIHLPVSGQCWWGGVGLGAWRDEEPIHGARRTDELPRIISSPAERAANARGFLALLLRHFPDAELSQLPGALKFCRVAEGLADAYPRVTPSAAWDIAAGHALVEAAGGTVLGEDGRDLRYRMAPGWPVPGFLAVGDAGAQWLGEVVSRASR